MRKESSSTKDSGSRLSSENSLDKKNGSSPPPVSETVAQKETKAVHFLRIAFFVLLVATATATSMGVYRYTRSSEKDAFEADYETNADRIINSFHDTVERKLGAINSMSTSITSYALDKNRTFPFVTIPNFSVRGSDLRVQADAMIIHWMPLITDETRTEWEEYALENRHQIDDAFEEDTRLRQAQDKHFDLQDERALESRNNTILDDGSGYHAKIYSNGAITPLGDEAVGSGPYLPLWQRSPVNAGRQNILNLNFANAKVFQGILPAMMQSNEAIMNRASIPIASGGANFAQNLALSQYRGNAEEYLSDPITFFAYPVFDTFKDERELVGVVATNVYWKLFFTDILPSSATGYICILENSFNQSLVYRIDGPLVTFLGEGDPHDTRYDHLEAFADINSYVESRARPDTRSYTTVSLNKEFGKYTLRIYPSQETEDHFVTSLPWIYTVSCVCVFLFNAIVFIIFVWVVEQRQKIVMEQVVKAAAKSTSEERELNEFLAHEVRNPLSAALTAHEFVTSAIKETPQTVDDEKKSVEEDLEIIGASLHFIDDFLRSILDINRAAANKLVVHLAPSDLLKDILEPVSNMLYQRGADVEVSVDCPENLVIETDSLRLKQIALNLGRNSSKFVTSGFIRFRAAVVEGLVELYVEDSGPGIPDEKRGALFDKFQSSLDLLSQGTGIGLSLCESLTRLLGGDIWLDESYDSGIQDSPGAKFVIQLKTSPVSNLGLLGNQNQGSSRLSFDAGNSSTVLATSERGFAENAELPENLLVLFVDDDFVLRKLFSRAVKKVAPTWRIQECANGETALRLVDTEQFDIIFMDQHMASTQKQLLGTETIRALRVKGVTSKICGLSANDIEQAFLSAGSDYFVMKPLPCEKNALKRELMRMC